METVIYPKRKQTQTLHVKFKGITISGCGQYVNIPQQAHVHRSTCLWVCIKHGPVRQFGFDRLAMVNDPASDTLHFVFTIKTQGCNIPLES